jgi:hypothetical protein
MTQKLTQCNARLPAIVGRDSPWFEVIVYIRVEIQCSGFDQLHHSERENRFADGACLLGRAGCHRLDRTNGKFPKTIGPCDLKLVDRRDTPESRIASSVLRVFAQAFLGLGKEFGAANLAADEPS